MRTTFYFSIAVGENLLDAKQVFTSTDPDLAIAAIREASRRKDLTATPNSRNDQGYTTIGEGTHESATESEAAE